VAGEHFDALETRDPELRERAQFAALLRQVAYAKAVAPAFAKILADVDAATVTSRAALALLPVTRKSELLDIQKDDRPFGGLAATDLSITRWSAGSSIPRRVFASPGPIYEPEGARPDYWRLARALFAAGFRPGHLIHNCFSYHFTPAGSMLETGAHALGCTVFPGGIGQTEQQVQAMADLKPDGYVGTPSFLRIILEKADEQGVALPSLRRALVSGEAFLPPLRDALAARGIAGFQVYASADLGTIAYETSARAGLVVDEGVLVEIVRPGTGDCVAPGEVGEVVVTTLTNTDYPLIRFGTGDLSALLPGISDCGRTNMRIKGWMGRADQTTKVKGMFVHPAQVAAIAGRHPGISKARLVVVNPDGNDQMTLHVETASGSVLSADAIVATIRDVTKLRGEVTFRNSGELANDGKVIDDLRKFD
jgi:phenylacetate-CoA ligase